MVNVSVHLDNDQLRTFKNCTKPLFHEEEPLLVLLCQDKTELRRFVNDKTFIPRTVCPANERFLSNGHEYTLGCPAAVYQLDQQQSFSRGKRARYSPSNAAALPRPPNLSIKVS